MQLLNRYAFAGGTGDTMSTDWGGFDASAQTVEFWVVCKTFSSAGGTLTVKMQTGMDMDEVDVQDAASTAVTATGTTITVVTSKIAQFIRLNLAVSNADVSAIISVWAVRKRD